MNQQAKVAAGGLVAVALFALSACGTPTSASAPPGTMAALNTPNYVTIAPVTTVAPTTPPSGPAAGGVTVTETIHKVLENESLGIIAKKYQISVDDLVEYNGFDSPSHVIHPGDEIKIPPGATLPGTSSGSSDSSDSSDDSGSSTESTEPGEGCTYKIVANDNPSKIAKKFGITLEQLKAANSADVMGTFLVGAELTIPPPANC